MKKLITILLTLSLIFSSAIAYGNESVGIFTEPIVLTTSINQTLYCGEDAVLSISVSGMDDSQNANLSMTLDGNLMGIGGEGYSKSSLENASFKFCVPMFSEGSLHTIETKLTLSDGAVITDSVTFTCEDSEDFKIFFSKKPETHNIWTDVSYTVQFACPPEREFFVRGTGYVNGCYIHEVDTYYHLKNGDTIDITVPAIYNNYSEKDFNFHFVLNVNGENPGLPTLYLSNKEKQINPVKIPAYTKYNVTSSNGIYIPAGTLVEYMNPDNHNSMRSCRVKLADGQVCWVPMSSVSRSDHNFTIADDLTDFDRENFVNTMGYESKTPYLIWVNKERQRLTVFLGSKGRWKALRTFPVATGKNATPTPTVVCEYVYKTSWVTPSYTCNPVLYLFDGYAIHNQPVSPAGYVTDKTIGNPASAGCIRMLKADADWVASYVPVKTTVAIY